ncbi:MAG TPA: aminotransferase class V-fold PLP-dependent enzyme [Solirubrobacteraceae bacterium]|jgi:L-cysteine/cystine lyase|nr:aminotransferase class V-fold PLP-dependent enzyme [Solirubrobacteraceae bacterium]
MRIFSPIVEPSDLRAQFPVLERIVYLNAGTDGPLPGAAVRAARTELERELADGRAMAHFERRTELTDALRVAYATALGGCEPADVALTTCTTEGLAHVIGGLDLKAGDEIVTSDEEHPGLLGPLSAARELHGVTVREVPLAQVAEAVGPKTVLVTCSHVGWVSGSYAPVELADVEVPVLLDGAQGIGAVDIDLKALGCDAYAGAGQKWMCGPDGTGAFYVSEALREQLSVPRRAYTNLENANAGLEAEVRGDARRFDAASMNAESVACSLAAAAVLESFGWTALRARARTLAARLSEMLADSGREVAPRGETTLVSWVSADAEGERERLAAQGVVIRNLPDRPLLRASVGAWNDDSDLERLLAALD